jgi:agmatine/peptidylarginine deiminase
MKIQIMLKSFTNYLQTALLTTFIFSLCFLNSAQAQTPPAGITTPPDGALRTMAEWEEIQALVITWTSYPTILRQIVAQAQTQCKVIIHCSDSNSVKTNLLNNGVPISTNVQFIHAPFNSVWIRDYAANSVYVNDVDSLLLVDWVYNRPSRVDDDRIPRYYAQKLNLPLYETRIAPNRLIHTGGNFMSNGFGQGFSSMLVQDENPTLSSDQVDGIMERFMNIQEYIKMTNLPYDGIHHIDMHMKLLDEETLLMGQYPEGVADGPQIEANLLYVMDNYTTVYGTPYKVVRIQMPPDQNNRFPDNNGFYRTFTNSVFVNKTLLVPTYEERYDTTALRILRENLPGYNVVSINSNQIITASGAIHCITHSVGVNDPLWISHQKYTDTWNVTTPYEIKARIQHRSGINNAKVYYRILPSESFTEAVMIPAPMEENQFIGQIPPQPGGAVIEYYIGAEANSEKQQVKPITAPEGYYRFQVFDTTSTDPVKLYELMLKDLFKISAFPNPSNSITCIPVHMKVGGILQLDLVDMQGRLVRNIHAGSTLAGENRYYLDASELAKGIYLIQAQTSFGKAVQKLVVK